MTKKTKRSALLTLLACLMTLGFAGCGSCGCGGGGNDSSSSSTSDGGDPTDTADTVLLNSFEDFAKDFRLINVGDGGIRVTRSTKRAMDGNYSAEVKVGGEYADSRVWFSLPLQSELYDFSYDLAEYKTLTCYVYSEHYLPLGGD